MVQAVVSSIIRGVCSSFMDTGAELSDHARTQWLRPRNGISSGIAMHGNFYGVTDPIPAECNLWQRRDLHLLGRAIIYQSELSHSNCDSSGPHEGRCRLSDWLRLRGNVLS